MVFRVGYRWFTSVFRAAPTGVVPLLMGGVLLTTVGCEVLPKGDAQAQRPPGQGESEEAVSVETAIAQTGALDEPLEYTGTTEPVRLVSLRSQAEGRLLDLNVDVGDTVTEGVVVGQLDDRLLLALLNQAQAELAARESEVAQAQAEVNDALAQVEQVRAELEQARADAERQQSLLDEGVTSEQDAERAQTQVRTAEQIVRSAEEQVRTRQQAVVAAQGRVEAQRSVVAEEQERRAYSLLVSPISGAVLERPTEPGNLVQPGDEVLRIGDFSAIKVMVQVSELELAGVRVGQPVQIRLDAFPAQTFRGQVTRIAPAADPTARLIPVEITMPNPGQQISSGLLARSQFQSEQAERVIIPETALEAAGEGDESTIFVVEGKGQDTKAIARSVQIGDRANGQVEILSGLEPGQAFIIRSSRPLKDNQPVRLSILSETQAE
ncbi:MAG: efflux RND transporter periplasmic adaptor subunit [Cyanobacteria bacterium CRU_2_1]|nr:efflux RND transporter periplasmic adaptor subunit [Cyanobacteria bacterium RU_5_0]NJR63160.1 efflux RND transporter periplasmic adaptor subunit [Cyanobacteria bacterium CRU_2_1]